VLADITHLGRLFMYLPPCYKNNKDILHNLMMQMRVTRSCSELYEES